MELIEPGVQYFNSEQYETAVEIFTEVKQLFAFRYTPYLLLLRARCLLKLVGSQAKLFFMFEK